MNGEQRAAFERLPAAEDAYVESHAREVDQGGSNRNIRTRGSQEIWPVLKRLGEFTAMRGLRLRGCGVLGPLLRYELLRYELLRYERR